MGCHTQPTGLSAPGTDPRRRYLIKMQRQMEKQNQGILEMIPPLRGGDFQGIAGLSSDDSLLGGVSTARERSFNKTPALSNIGSMSPARLSLCTVASPHCRLLFHLAGGILTAKQRKLSGAAQNQASVIAQRGLEVKLLFSTSGRGRNIFLDFPFYRLGHFTHCDEKYFVRGGLRHDECNGDISTIAEKDPQRLCLGCLGCGLPRGVLPPPTYHSDASL
jgi:hypothetical protein